MVDKMNAANVLMSCFGRMAYFYASMRDWPFEGAFTHYGIERTNEGYIELFDNPVVSLAGKEA